MGKNDILQKEKAFCKSKQTDNKKPVQTRGKTDSLARQADVPEFLKSLYRRSPSNRLSEFLTSGRGKAHAWPFHFPL